VGQHIRQAQVELQPKRFRISDTMRILLQHMRTQLFLRNLGNWTANPFEALDFENSDAAAAYAKDHDLPGVQIAVKFPNSQLDEIMPLPPIPPPTLRPPGPRQSEK